eukprot:COSAG01_NODE_12645_length_1704_cov_59.487850_2_plen_97_part_00
MYVQMMISIGGAFGSHVDPLDKENIGAVTWSVPAEVTSYYLHFENVAPKGLAIRLRHGRTIVWKGKYLRHGTSVARGKKKRPVKNVYGMFVSQDNM